MMLLETCCRSIAPKSIEVASVINRKGLARAGSWFMVYQIYLPAIDTIVTGMAQTTNPNVVKTANCECSLMRKRQQWEM